MRVVIDTNVFLSGIFWSGPPSRILDAWQEMRVKLVCSVDILNEYERVGEVLSKKYKQVDIGPILDLVIKSAELYVPVKLIEQVSRDPDDEMFIATAVAGKCNYIISGDKDLLDVDGYSGLCICKPATFVKEHL